MGNHEFCFDCHESDHHDGRTCEEAYPESFKKVQAEKVAARKEQNRGRILLDQLKAELESRGVENIYTEYSDCIDRLVVCGFQLARAENKP